jgi:DNA-binding winged helix-turn-helix (wHTH) protein
MKKFECFRLDQKNQRLWLDGTQIAIPPKPFAVLTYLVENAGRLVSHDELMENLWPETYVQPQVLRTYVLDLRKILKDEAARPRFIQTLPKRGYCFVAAVSDCAETASARPMPAEAEVSSATSPVGREAELAKLITQAELVLTGQRRVVFITGEAGIGKTALLDEFCHAMESKDSSMLGRGQCVPGTGGTEDYYPVMEALGHLCASRHGEAACRVLSKIAPMWMPHGSRHGSEPALGAQAEVQRRTIGD